MPLGRLVMPFVLVVCEGICCGNRTSSRVNGMYGRRLGRLELFNEILEMAMDQFQRKGLKYVDTLI